MKQLVVLAVLPALLVISIRSGFGYQGGTAPNRSEQVYEAREVDKQAKFRNLSAVMEKLREELDCPEGTIKLTLLLHRSGKISDIKTEGTRDCKATEAGLTALRKLKFTPAIKNGVKVSQYETFEIKRELTASPGNPQ